MTCSHRAPASCDLCDGTAADLLDAVLDMYGPTGEVCAGLDAPGEPCARRAETGSPYCDLHSVLAADLLPVEVMAA